MGSLGYFNLSGTRDDYWNRAGHNNQFNVGYGVTVMRVYLNLNWSQNKQTSASGEYRTDRITSLSVNVPFDRWMGIRHMRRIR
jgi:outer membrane usher protein